MYVTHYDNIHKIVRIFTDIPGMTLTMKTLNLFHKIVQFSMYLFFLSKKIVRNKLIQKKINSTLKYVT